METTQGMEPITVSVLIATYNRARYLPEALDSILAQTRKPDEIIVIDDGSTDHTAEVVWRYAPRVQYRRMPRNSGKAAALNSVLSDASGTHIWVFDDDDVALPDALEAHVAFLSTHPEFDFAYSTNYRHSSGGDIWERDRWIPKDLPDYPVEQFFISTALAMHTMQQGMLVPKRCYASVGPYDATLPRCQDVEMLLRLALRFNAANLRKPTFVLRDHPGVRGPRGHEHNARQRNQRWVKCNQQIFRKVRATFPLGAFLPGMPGQHAMEPHGSELGYAMIQRGCIMLRHGLAAEALADIGDGLHALRAMAIDGTLLRSMLSAALHTDSATLQRPVKLALALKRLLLSDAGSLLTAARHGIYWAFRSALRNHEWRSALRSLLMLAATCCPVLPAGVAEL